GEPLFEITTDKTTLEAEAYADGVLRKRGWTRHPKAAATVPSPAAFWRRLPSAMARLNGTTVALVQMGPLCCCDNHYGRGKQLPGI
ncbi:MAG: hypothetical protein N3A38_08830, partial [Planctomycetota bacterium]|nr:hypothetical protein [Planctomycetota bacterium]